MSLAFYKARFQSGNGLYYYSLNYFVRIAYKIEKASYICTDNNAKQLTQTPARRASEIMKVLTANYRTDVENSVNYANIATSNGELNGLVAQLYGEMAAEQRQILEARGEGVSIRRSGADRAEKLKAAGFTSNSLGFVTPTGKVELSDVAEYSQHDGLHPVVGTTGKVTVTLF